MPKLTLYTYWRSSASFRVRIALGFKGLAYESVPVNLLASEQTSDAYRSQNPIGYLPCLVIDGVKYVESTAIMELLEEIHPSPPLLPETPLERARVRALMQYVNAGIQPLQNLNVLEYLSPDQERRNEWMRHFITRGFAAWNELANRFEQDAGKKSVFAYGDRFSAADVLLIPQIYASRRVAIDLSAYPAVARVAEATKDLPFVKAAWPDAQPDAKL